MKASVLIANFNGEKFIDQCIQSLQNQSCTDFEIIFFDDCSTDNSLKIVKKYKNVNIIENKNHSPVGAFNQINAYKKAFLNSTGDIIFTLDSDDFFYPEKISKVIKYHENNIKIAFDLPTVIKGDTKQNLLNKSKKLRLSFFPFITQQSCMSVKRDVFSDMIEKVDIKMFHDVWFDFRAGVYAKYKFSKPFIIDEHLTFYRVSPTNVSYKFKHLSNLWWKRRLEYHYYEKLYCEKNKYKYLSNFDYYITKIFNYIYK